MKARYLFGASFLAGFGISSASGMDMHIPQIRVESSFIEPEHARTLFATKAPAVTATRERGNLVILVTPHLIRPAD